MTPLGHQIARLLQPEHWEEWTPWPPFGIVHRRTRILLSVESWFRVHVANADLGLMDRMLLWSAARRLQRHFDKQVREERLEAFRARLMTAEERAIEELLRS